MLIKDLEWTEETRCDDEDTIYYATTTAGRFSVLDRLTGFGSNIRDTETGFKASDGKFWLASGMFDIRTYPDLTIEEAIKKIKENANNCIGD